MGWDGPHGAAKRPLEYVGGWTAGTSCTTWGMRGLARRRHTTRPSEVQDTTASSSSRWSSVLPGSGDVSEVEMDDVEFVVCSPEAPPSVRAGFKVWLEELWDGSPCCAPLCASLLPLLGDVTARPADCPCSRCTPPSSSSSDMVTSVILTSVSSDSEVDWCALSSCRGSRNQKRR